MKGLVFCGLSDKKLTDKIMPLLSSECFTSLQVFRSAPGKRIPRVTYFAFSDVLKKSPILSWIFRLVVGCVQAIRETDSIIISYNAIPHGIIGFLVSCISRRKHVLALIGTDIHYWFKNGIVRSIILAICRRSFRVIVTGKVSASVLESYGIDSVHAVRNTIDVTQCSIDDLTRKKSNSAIFVGGLSRNKRVDRVLQLVKEVNQRGVKLTCSIVGDGEEYHNLRELAAQLDISGLVNFMGYRHDVNEIMSSHLALCLFSENEGFPTVIAEALCNGLCVLAIGAGDVPDIATTPNPLLVYQQFWDVDFFAERLIAILENPTEIQMKRYVQYFRDFFAYENGGVDWRNALFSITP